MLSALLANVCENFVKRAGSFLNSSFRTKERPTVSWCDWRALQEGSLSACVILGWSAGGWFVRGGEVVVVDGRMAEIACLGFAFCVPASASPEMFLEVC